MTYATREQAERAGIKEASILTRRGYPTKLVEVISREVRTSRPDYTMGNQDSDWNLVTTSTIRWEPILADQD